MILRLRANETEEILAEFLRRENGPAALSELDVTDCVLLDPGKLPSLLVQCSYLTSLRCLGCGFRPSDFIAMLWRLRALVEVEFSLMLETDVESELLRIGQAAAQYGSEPKASGLRRMYVEVGATTSNFCRHFCIIALICTIYTFTSRAAFRGALFSSATMPSSQMTSA
ncbi:hypothetical protein MTO96_021553 [Rhipicephalus appendiculatus]